MRESESQKMHANKIFFLVQFHIFKCVYFHFSTFKLSQKSTASEGTDAQSETFIYELRELESPCG